MQDLLKLLVIDDSVDDGFLILRHVRMSGLELVSEQVWKWQDFVEAIERESWDLIICDHRLPTFQSSDVMAHLRKSNVETPLILVSGCIEIETAILALRNGACDYMGKEDLSRLVPAIQRELERAEIRNAKRKAESDLKEANQRLTLTLHSLANAQSQLIAVERFRALGQMACGIAHDFNNGLTKMLGVVESIGAASTEVSEDVDRLRSIISDAAGVVRRLCDFYRESPMLDAAPVDLGPLLLEVRELTRPRWRNIVGNQTGHIEFMVEPGAQSMALADAGQLREVLTNLVFNACDAITGSGTVTLISRDVDDMVEVEVKDDGSGMTAEVLSRCLDPLYTTKGEKGTGMGLAIVQALVQAWEGKVTVRSCPGQGTSVILSLQKNTLLEKLGEKDSRRAMATASENNRSLKIVIVDDEPIILKLLERHLAVMGHCVVTVTDPRTVGEVLGEGFYDLVISDRSMPLMNGDELAKSVRMTSPQTRFAMVTGFGDLMLANVEMPEGVDVIVPKPISSETLRMTLSTLFDLRTDAVELAG